MKLQSVHELENTRRKLRDLEEAYEAAMKRPTDNAHAREATLTSLRRLINQLNEEIVRYEAHQSARRAAARS
jgi:polyhydroxyalkanoate synthesis regulator phasin